MREKPKKEKNMGERKKRLETPNSNNLGKFAIASVALLCSLQNGIKRLTLQIVFLKTEQELLTLSLLSLLVMMISFFFFMPRNSKFSDELATQLTTLPIFLILSFGKPFASYRPNNI